MKYPTVKIISRIVFKSDESTVEIHEDQLLSIPEEDMLWKEPNIQVRLGGPFGNKGFYLSQRVDWIIVCDDLGALVLVPLKKE